MMTKSTAMLLGDNPKQFTDFARFAAVLEKQPGGMDLA
jgi:hypothetical protein